MRTQTKISALGTMLVCLSLASLARAQSAPPNRNSYNATAQTVTLGAHTYYLPALQLVASDAVPKSGSFRRLSKLTWPALPFNNVPGCPVYRLGNHSYLIDDTAYDYSARAAQAETEAVARTALQMLGLDDSQPVNEPPPMDGPLFDTNALWLEITNVASGLAYANLRNGTNQVYAVWGTTNVGEPFGLWQVETGVWPADPSCQPFTGLTLGRTELFLRAQDWSGVDSDADGIPDWWIWYYFGDLAHTANDPYCGSLLYYYTNGLDPNPLTAYTSDVLTCAAEPVSLTLSGWATCSTPARGILYSIVVGPQHGTLTGTPGPDGNYVYTPTNASFTGTDSFSYRASIAWGGNSVTGQVNIVVGDAYLWPNSQTAMTGTNQPVSLLLTASGPLSCSDITYILTAGPTNGGLSGIPPNVVYTPTNNYEGEDHFSFTVSNGVWGSIYENASVTLYVVAGPHLAAQCRSDRIILNWSLDSITQQLIVNSGLSIYGFLIYRSTIPGAFDATNLLAVVSAGSMSYYDTAVAPGMSYYYAVTFRYQDPYTATIYESPFSNLEPSSTCQPPYEGPMDVAFIIDNTGSMQASLAAIKQSIASVLSDIAAASSNDYRLAIVTPDTNHDRNPTNNATDGTGHDMVIVRLPFTNNTAVFSNELDSIEIGSGNGWPESTDECLNTVVNALTAAGRLDTNQCADADKLLQLGDFAPSWRTNAMKRVVLITDAIPGGFCDSGNAQAQADQYATEARAKGIKINAVQIFNFLHQDTTPVMEDYSTLSCGWYWLVPHYSNAQSIQDGIVSMLYLPNVCD